MWKYKQYQKIFILLLIYIPAASFYLLMIPRHYLTVHLIYSDIYLFMLKAGLFLIYSEGDQSIFEHQLHRFPRMNCFYKWKAIQFSIQNLLFISGIAFIDIVILLIAQAPMDGLALLLYTCFLLFCLQVIQLFVLSGITNKKYNMRRYCIVLILVLSFLLCVFNNYEGVTPINPFCIYFLPMINKPISYHYFIAPAVYLLLALLLCYQNKRRIKI